VTLNVLRLTSGGPLRGGAALLVRAGPGLAAGRLGRKHQRALRPQRLRELQVLLGVGAGGGVGALLQLEEGLAGLAGGWWGGVGGRAGSEGGSGLGVGAVQAGSQTLSPTAAASEHARHPRSQAAPQLTGGTLLSLRFMNWACSLMYAMVLSSTNTP